jgi:hypothetical protein
VRSAGGGLTPNSAHSGRRLAGTLAFQPVIGARAAPGGDERLPVRAAVTPPCSVRCLRKTLNAQKKNARCPTPNHCLVSHIRICDTGLLQSPSWHGRPAHETRARCPCHTCTLSLSCQTTETQRYRGFWVGMVRFFYPQINRLRRFFGALLGFWNHRAHREHRVLGEGHGSVVSREGAKARRLEGESPREPASAQVPSRSTGRASARPRASRRLPDPASQA